MEASVLSSRQSYVIPANWWQSKRFYRTDDLRWVYDLIFFLSRKYALIMFLLRRFYVISSVIYLNIYVQRSSNYFNVGQVYFLEICSYTMCLGLGIDDSVLYNHTYNFFVEFMVNRYGCIGFFNWRV